MTININTVKVGDRVVITNQTARRQYSRANDALEPGKVYVISGVHKQGGQSGTVSLAGEFNQSAPVDSASWHPGSFGYCLFKKAPEPTTLAGATDQELIEALQGRGYRGALEHEVTSTETVTL